MTTGHLHSGGDGERWTIWYHPSQPDLVKVTTGDARFTDEDGGKPGLFITVRRGCTAFDRIARALRDAGQPHPPV